MAIFVTILEMIRRGGWPGLAGLGWLAWAGLVGLVWLGLGDIEVRADS
ncbi:hypothetical protein [Arcanobacterium haemolyticum]|nr:hypothetical protein [Arcanobacterium haemolyticum]